MEGTPTLPETNGFEAADYKQPDPEQLTKPPIPPPETVPAEAPTNYELEIAPDLTARVELTQKPEVEFERRHEVLDEDKHPQPVVSRMTPLSQVLADYPTSQARASDQPVNSQDSTSPRISLLKTVLSKPTYRRAIIIGATGGVIVILTMFILIFR